MIIVLLAACGGGAGQAPTPPPVATTGTVVAPTTGTDQPPVRDLIDLARRLGSLLEPPAQVDLPPPVLGEEQPFDLILLPSDPDERPERQTTTAILRAVSEHGYFFVEPDADVADSAVDAGVRSFEEEVWPIVTGAFGPPPIPGVDGDPRIVILHIDLGAAVGGYVSNEDAYPRAVVPHSNQREMIYLDVDSLPPGSPGYPQVLAHELQHLIHREHDSDEETWVNEGLSEIAARLVGGGEGFYSAFLDRPDTQLNAWTALGSSAAHYGASSLFFGYLLEQTGGDVRRLAAEPANGVDGVRAFLEASGARRTFTEFVADWAIANFLDQPQGVFGYSERQVSPPNTAVIDALGEDEGDVRQFAADYLEVRADDFQGPVSFVFKGDVQVPVVAAQEDATGAFWWSNRGDNIDSTLTRELDLTGVRQATLTFRTWYDIERWYDFGYVVASTDGGRTWDVLAGRETTTDDPLAVSYGPGYTGRSGGDDTPRWLEERIDLSAYAGSRVLLRFEYVTDEGTNGSGWAIDDIAVPEIGFLDDGETDAGGWQRAGFRRLTDTLPQRFKLRLITLGPAPAVEPVALDASNRAQIRLDGLGSEYQSAVIVVIGATEGTIEPAGYRYELSAIPTQ